MMIRALAIGSLLSLFVVGCGKNDDDQAAPNDGGTNDGAIPDGTPGLDGGPAPPGFELVADLNTRKAAGLSTSYTRSFVEAGGKVYFVGDNGQHGYEPMVSDGTPTGTKLLKDTVAGSDDGSAGGFIAKGDKVYFFGRSSSSMALWRTDGTPEGTMPVIDNAQGSSSTQSFQVGDKLCFLDSSLRCSNEAVTALTKVLDSTSSFSGSSASLGSVAVFTNSNALWSTDGTTATKLVDVSIQQGGVVVGGKLVFWAQASGQTRPFMSDGTVAGSRVLGDMTATGGTPPMFALGSRALTVTNAQAVILDPTAITATPLTDLVVTSALGLGTGKVLLAAERRSVSPLIGSELWITDGTDAGTTLVSDLAPGSGASYIQWLGTIGNQAFFVQNDASSPTHWLYKSDGTPTGTVKIGEWTTDASMERYTPALGKLFFHCGDASSWQTLCTLDATGKVTVVPINRATASSSPSSFVTWGEGKFFVQANDGAEPRSTYVGSMFVSDGTTVGTKKVGGRFGGRIANLAGKSLFLRVAPDPMTDKWELAMFNGDPSLAITVASFNYANNLEYAAQYPIVSFAGKVWFAANPSSSTFYVYSSDTTATGTKSTSYTPSANYAQYGGADWPIVGDKLFVPTTTGVQVVDSTGTMTSLGAAPGKVTAIDAAGGRVWFAINGTLWFTDGTAAGTLQVKVVSSSSSNPIWKIAAVDKDTAFVFTGSGSSPTAWVSDGTEAGTLSVGSVPSWVRFKAGLAFAGSSGLSLVSAAVRTPVVIGPRANKIFSSGDRLFFSSTDELRGEELWVSDGTKAGTKIAGDLRIGKESSSPTPLGIQGGYLYLSADNGAIGTELWRYRVN